MTLLVVGVSTRTAKADVLAQVALARAEAARLAEDVLVSEHVAEALVLSTCNRVEVYAEVAAFHAAVADVTDALVKATGVPAGVLTDSLGIAYDGKAVEHVFDVAAGLDSIVMGESQILGQVRSALADAQDHETIGRDLNELFQAALRLGKRVRSETGIGRAGASLVSIALDAAEPAEGPALSVGRGPGPTAFRRVVIVGAGSVAALAARALVERGVTDIVIANRTPGRARQLAGEIGARVVALTDVKDALAGADLVITGVGAREPVLTVADFGHRSTNVTVIDLGRPHDSDPAIADLPHVRRIDLDDLARLPGATASLDDQASARAMVAEEMHAFVVASATRAVEPVVSLLQAQGETVVREEMARLRLRTPDLSQTSADEIAISMRRAVRRVLHTPTVRAKQLGAAPDGEVYTRTLRQLFDIDADTVRAFYEANRKGS